MTKGGRAECLHSQSVISRKPTWTAPLVDRSFRDHLHGIEHEQSNKNNDCGRERGKLEWRFGIRSTRIVTNDRKSSYHRCRELGDDICWVWRRVNSV
jgi:hypothetical protein